MRPTEPVRTSGADADCTAVLTIKRNYVVMYLCTNTQERGDLPCMFVIAYSVATFHILDTERNIIVFLSGFVRTMYQKNIILWKGLINYR